MEPKTILVGILLAIGLLLLVQNTQVVTLRFLFWDIAMSQILLLPLLMALGFAMGYLVARLRGHRGRG